MQTENVYLKAYSKVVGEAESSKQTNLREFYESQLASAGIPRGSLHKVYLQMQKESSSRLAELKLRQQKARENLLAIRAPACYKKKLDECIASNKLYCLSVSILMLLLAMIVVSNAIFNTPITEALLTTQPLGDIILTALPAAFITYPISRVLTANFVNQKSLKLYEDEVAQLEQDYQEAEREYRNLETMLEVIKTACVGKPKPQAI